MILRRLSVVALSVAAALAVGAPASAAPSKSADLLSKTATSAAELDQQISEYLKLHPGGTKIAKNQVSHHDGNVITTFPDPTAVKALAGPNCPDGWFCAYDGRNYTGVRKQYTAYYFTDMGLDLFNDRAESLHNNTNTKVQFGNWTGTFTDYTVCLHRWTAKASLGTWANKLDHAYRSSSDGFC
jgi:hypothetical protein